MNQSCEHNSGLRGCYTKENLDSYHNKMGLIDTLLKGMVSERSRINAFILAGAPGIGKTYTVMNSLNEMSNSKDIVVKKLQKALSLLYSINKLSDEEYQKSKESPEDSGRNHVGYEVVRGQVTPMEVYNILMRNKEKNFFTIFDDSDSVFQNTMSMNLLKAAADTTPVRKVSWGSRGSAVKDFIYEGKIIILTNVDLKDNPHFQALRDRFFCYDPEISPEERFSKIVDIARNSTSLSEKEIDEAIEYMESRLSLDSITLRSFVKTSMLVEAFPDNWKSIASRIVS